MVSTNTDQISLSFTQINTFFVRSIQAALEFPEAEVIAVDLNPLPNRYITHAYAKATRF